MACAEDPLGLLKDPPSHEITLSKVTTCETRVRIWAPTREQAEHIAVVKGLADELDWYVRDEVVRIDDDTSPA